MARFYVGQPVICVKGGSNPNASRRYPGLRWPRKGQRYVIRCAEVPQRGRMNFVLVAGLRNRVITWPCGTRYEAGFHEDRFEPATDIGQLKDVATLAGMLHERHINKPVRVKPKRKKEDA